MNFRTLKPLTILSLLIGAGLAAAAPSLTAVATYDTLLGSGGAEILNIRASDGLAALTNASGSVDVLDLADPTAPALLRRITVSGTPNSVAVHPRFDYLLVVSGTAGNVGTVAAYRASDGMLLATSPVGIQPDSIAIAPNGEWALVANEAEGSGVGNNGGDGSLSLVDLLGFDPANPTALSVEAIALPSQADVAGFSTGRTDDAARLAVDNTPATLEPETVAFSRSSRYAWVSLQENNGVVRFDMMSRTLRFFGLGTTSHLADLSTSGGYMPTSTLTAFREPDGVALVRNGKYFVTADEGDTRDGAGSGAPRGGRTVSIFEARTGAFVADTGGQLDDAANAAGVYPDARSNRGGSEPEVVDVVRYRGRTLVAVGLERANLVALIDMTVPTTPTVVATAPTGALPEGIKFMRVGSDVFLTTANEGAGTVSIFRVEF